MRRWYVLPLLAVAVALLAWPLAAGALPDASSSAAVWEPSAAQAGCLTRSASALEADQVGHFTVITNDRITQPPWTGMPGRGEPLWVRDWRGGRLKGFIANISLHGRYRAAENRWARSHGYPIKKFPYVPLTGLVVRDNAHRVLEVYEEVFVFRSRQATASWVKDTTAGHQLGRRLKAVPQIGDSTRGYRAAFGPNDNYEHAVRLIATAGSLGLRLDVRGGASVPTSTAIELTKTSFSRLRSACSH